MREIQQFSTEDPKRLTGQLSDFEHNVVAETADIRQSFDITPVPTARITKGGGVYTVGQAVIADTTAGAFSINLAAPANKLPGRMVAIQISVNALTLVPLAPAQINLATSGVVGPGIKDIYFDGANFWMP